MEKIKLEWNEKIHQLTMPFDINGKNYWFGVFSGIKVLNLKKNIMNILKIILVMKIMNLDSLKIIKSNQKKKAESSAKIGLTTSSTTRIARNERRRFEESWRIFGTGKLS